MAKRSLLGSIISVICTSAVVFFVIYFFAPESSDQFFGTSVRDGKVNERIPMITEEQLEDLEEYLRSGKARNTLVRIGKVTAEGASELLSVLKESL